MGDIHPLCMFAKYRDELLNGCELTFAIDMPDSQPLIVFKGKVLYTYKRRGKEELGVMFTSITQTDLKALEDIVLQAYRPLEEHSHDHGMRGI